MKVCDIVVNSVWHDPRVIKQIKEYSQDNQISLSVVGKVDDRYNVDEINKIPADSVDIVKKPSRFFRSIFINIYDFLSLRKAIIRTKPDIIHANDLDALVPAFLASRKLKCKVIYDTHEIFLENNWVYSNYIYRIFWGFLESFIIKRVDAVVCVSNAAADYFKLHYNIKRPLVITNCVSRINENSLSSTKNEGFEVLLHGQFYKGRGCDVMVEAANVTKSTDVKYALRGFGNMEKELRQYVECHKLTNVIFYPPVKTWELIEEAAKSHVGVAITIPYCLNFKLSISNKIFEYLAAGLPVIMSDIPEHRYLNDKYHFGLVLEENSPECLSEAVLKMYNDKDLYKKCTENARRISREINWENEFAKLLELEKSLTRK